MAGLSKNRRKKAAAQPSMQDLLLSLAKAVGTDHTQEYNPDTFSSMWVDLYTEGDEESYQEQGAYVHGLLQQLETVLLNTQQTTAIVAQERTTRIWNTRNLQLQNATDTQFVDELLYYGKTTVTPVLEEDTTSEIHLMVINPDV